MRLAGVRCAATETAPVLRRRGRELWTPDADAFLQRHARCCRSPELARRLGVTRSAIRNRLWGLRRCDRSILGHRWTTKEDGELRRLAGSISVAEIAQRLGRTGAGVRIRAVKLGVSVRRPTGWVESDGYIMRSRDGRRERQHRRVMERTLGRSLDPAERVHHINLVKTDNASANLHVCRGDAEHLRAHRSLDRLVPALLEREIIKFDRAAGVYRLVGAARR